MERLNYDAETGAFVWRRSFGRAKGGTQAGRSTNQRYAYVCVLGETFLAHRLAWFYVMGDWPKGEIDHINGNKFDNRFCNLRDVPHATNTQNIRAPHKRNVTSGFLGVRRRHGAAWFNASISVNRKHHNLGRFDTAEEAHAAYLEAKRKLHAGCTI